MPNGPSQKEKKNLSLCLWITFPNTLACQTCFCPIPESQANTTPKIKRSNLWKDAVGASRCAHTHTLLSLSHTRSFHPPLVWSCLNSGGWFTHGIKRLLRKHHQQQQPRQHACCRRRRRRRRSRRRDDGKSPRLHFNQRSPTVRPPRSRSGICCCCCCCSSSSQSMLSVFFFFFIPAPLAHSPFLFLYLFIYLLPPSSLSLHPML